ncbi:hypothetical protein JCM18897A_54740 [Streptomyces sp. JCM 18897]
MTGRHELSDAECDLLRPLLPISSTGPPRSDAFEQMLQAVRAKADAAGLPMWVWSSTPVTNRRGVGASPGE